MDESQPGEPALPRLLQWVADQDAAALCVVLGDYGSGKTFLARQLAAEMLAARQRGERMPAPLYIDLRTLSKSRLQAEEILAVRLRQLGLRGEDAATLLRAIHAGLVLPILDGFDEIAVHLPLGERSGFF